LLPRLLVRILEHVFDDVIEKNIIEKAARKGRRLTHILIGSEVSSKFKKSTFVTNLKQMLNLQTFNYRPINIDAEVTANGERFF
jgi:hypothetical protein